jgi:hypothetical protein
VAALEYCMEQCPSTPNSCTVKIILILNRRDDSKNVGKTFANR